MIDMVTILLILAGIIFLIFIIIGVVLLIIFKRRKWIWTNFLSDSGKWERKHWDKIDKEFDFEGVIYEFDIKKCTRDNWNRPIAHYYKNNPKQQIFNYANSVKSIEIGTEEIKPKDFRQIMLTKIIRDLFNDDEYLKWFIMILITCVIGFIMVSFFIFSAGNKPCDLMMSNETLNVIAEGVKIGVKNIN